MMKQVWCAVAGNLCVLSPFAQTAAAKAASDAFLLARMVDKFHVQPRPLDDNLSLDFYNLLLQKLDDDKIFFTSEDIIRLRPYSLQLDDQLKAKKYDFLLLVTTIFEQRLSQDNFF